MPVAIVQVALNVAAVLIIPLTQLGLSPITSMLRFSHGTLNLPAMTLVFLLTLLPIHQSPLTPDNLAGHRQDQVTSRRLPISLGKTSGDDTP